ncbi:MULTISPECIES: TetR/AcrR family transcriptional regulator [Mycolicibacterium]|nr:MULTISPECIES: TetR/AcrR family transcriptional regulator [Mycolicibacterium]MCW1823696.1 TetR/AcrR family transcriptional regulator [Mycolicibacterium senegalense]
MTHSAAAKGGGPWKHQLAGGLRKRPVQERSRTMVEHILRTAAEVVVEVGYEAVVGSPTLLLERSGISRGSFYAFFETPERVLDELSYQKIQQSIAGIDSALRGRSGEDWTEIIDALVGYYTTEHRIPLIRELWVRQNLTSRVRELDNIAIGEIAAMTLAQFRKHAPLFADLSELQCRVAIHTLERLCQLAFSEDPNGDPAIIEESRVILVEYFAAYAER